MRTLQILNFISENGYPATLKQISEGLQIPLSSTYDIVNTMLEMKYLQYADKVARTYFIGLKAFRSGAAYIRDIDFVKVAKPYLKEMSKKTKATAFLGVKSDENVVYLDKVEENVGVRTTALLGVGKGMYYTGLGKAILATMPTEEVEKLYRGKKLVAKTSNTICDLEKLKEELFLVRQLGYAVDNEEGERAIFCIAAPVRNYESNVVAAISIANLKEVVEHKGVEKYINVVVDSAMKISRELGYTGNSLFYNK